MIGTENESRSGVWTRLAAMSWDEIRTRGRQEIAKRLDLARYRLGITLGTRTAHPGSEIPGSFFFDPHELPRLVGTLRERLPNEAVRIIEEADRVCDHRFDVLGYRNLDYGREIDWHLDVVHGKRAPYKPWFKIPYLDFNQVGDHKVVWELNRHQHLVTLAKAYCLTHKEQFLAELLGQWHAWQQANPYPMGINWASSLEVAFRSLSWLWVQRLLDGCSALPQAFQSDLTHALALNGRHIERYLSTYFSPNTHLLGEGVALFFIGTLCPYFSTARRWQQRGWEIVLREAERQVRPDGMHFERSTYYHVYALDFFLHARTLAVRNKILIPCQFDRTLERMLEFLCTLAQAGVLPRIGDDDGGRVFDHRRNTTEHMLDPLATGAIIYNRADFKATVGGLHEEALWLLGIRGVTRFEEIPSASPVPRSLGFEDSGIYIMSSSGHPPEQLAIDAGPNESVTGGHGHADALSIQLAVSGHEWLLDSGTFCYASNGPERDLFRGTAAHNTLQVDNLSQADPAGPFGWRWLPSVRADLWIVGRGFDLFAGSHSGYTRLPQPVVHQRWVFGLKSRFWMVRDLALGEGSHQLDLFWHFAPPFLPSRTQRAATVLWAERQGGLALVAAGEQKWSQQITQGKVSRAYGEEEWCPVIKFERRASLPVEFAVLLVPVAEPFADPGAFEQLYGGTENSGFSGYRYRTREDCHYIFFARRGQGWDWGRWASDAQFLYFGVAPGDKLHFALCEGTYAELEGKRFVALKRPVARFELIMDGATERVFCTDEGALSHLTKDVLFSAEAVLLGGASSDPDRKIS